MEWYFSLDGISIYRIVFAVVLGYAIGNVSPAIIIGKIKNVDIRQQGSGNPGTTNVLRVLGKKAAAITLAIDVLKGVVAVLAGNLIGGTATGMIAGIFAFAGHIWPAVFGFKGGKGVATGIGLILTVNPEIGIIVLVTALIIMALTKTVSAGSVFGAVIFPITAYFVDSRYLLWASVTAVIVLVRHKDNIKRLIKGTESKINFKK